MISDLHLFLHRFFELHECEVQESNDGLLSVQLTRELDEALMNRPFYWHYMDKLNQQGEPSTLQLDINKKQKDSKREWIHFGSPRLQQIFQFINNKAKYTVLYERRETTIQEPLYPWLICNLRVNYNGLQKKEVIYSIGLHLIHGAFVLNMMKRLEPFTFEQRMSDYTYSISPIIRPHSGLRRVFDFIENNLEQEDLSWAQHATKTLKEEIELLHHFYREEEKEELFEQEKENLTKRLSPSISIEIINAGVFYISNESTSKLLKE